MVAAAREGNFGGFLLNKGQGPLLNNECGDVRLSTCKSKRLRGGFWGEEMVR